MSTPSTPTRPSPAALGTLLSAAAALSGLAVYQWVELLAVRSGLTPSCAVNDTINCATVWNSPFAGKVHELLGIPVAGLGLLWGLTALALPVLLLLRKDDDATAFLTAIKLWAGAGLLATVTFAAASVQARALCLTCLGTYALTVAYGVGAFALLPKPTWPDTRYLVPGGAWALVLSAPIFLGLLYPGGRTPRTTTSVEVKVDTAGSGDPLRSWLDSLSLQEKLQAAYARSVYLTSRPKDVSDLPARTRHGPADAPVQVVEFTDILCGHCRVFEHVLGQLIALDPSRISVEARYYPLDSECNPDVQHSTRDGLRCLGAKAQLCLAQHPQFLALRRELFERQSTLTKDFIFEVAARAGLGRDALQACVDSPETQRRLEQDLTYGRRYGIEGTPLVLVNGRVAPPSPAFLTGLVLANGDANAPIFDELPPPPQP